MINSDDVSEGNTPRLGAAAGGVKKCARRRVLGCPIIVGRPVVFEWRVVGECPPSIHGLLSYFARCEAREVIREYGNFARIRKSITWFVCDNATTSVRELQ
jgi:hypothetical protein